MSPSFSIIIPALNEEKYLPGCLESVFGLDYPRESFEVIVVDNGSSDQTRSIAESFGAKVLKDDSMNVSGLRNLGARNASGDILAFVDADCIVYQDWLKRASDYFDDASVAAWGAPAGVPEDATWVQRAWYYVRQKEKTIQEADWLETMNLFVRKRQFFTVGGFNENLVTCEDVDFSYRIRKLGKIISDSRLRVIHLGEAGTLSHFIKKEIWRGRSNYQGVRSHGFSIKEIPSLSIPLYFGLFLPVLVILALFIFPLSFSLWAVPLFLLLPSLGALMKVRRKKIGVAGAVQLLVLLQAYFFSRTIAVFRR